MTEHLQTKTSSAVVRSSDTDVIALGRVCVWGTSESSQYKTQSSQTLVATHLGCSPHMLMLRNRHTCLVYGTLELGFKVTLQ